MSSLLPPSSWLRRFAAAVILTAAAVGVGSAATMSTEAPLHTQPDESSPVVGTLPAGMSITSMLREELAAAGLEAPPPGWIVIRSPGPFAGFVRNNEVGNDGTIQAGAQIRAQPLADAPLLLVVEAGDVATAREPLGDWSRATIHTDLIVYVNALPAASGSQMTEEVAEVQSESVPVASESVAPDNELMIDTAPPPDRPRRGVRPRKAREPQAPREPEVEPTAVESTGTPRTFVGYLMRTRRFLGRGPKYDYQLVDEGGRRITLLDVSALLATATIESFENRRVSVYGPGLSRPDVQDPIIRVQTLRLER